MPRADRLLVGLAAAAAVLLGGSGVASADPAQPTNYVSSILATDPPLPAGVELQVVGGDAFLELTVAPGHTVEVADTTSTGDDEPIGYLRFEADGTVLENRNSLSAQTNDSRYGTARNFDADAPADWQEVATNGTWAWHDHRIHWMSPTTPTAIDAAGRVNLGGPDGVWEVPIVVDGTATEVTGELVLLDAPTPVGWVTLAVLVALAVAAGGWWATRSGGPLPHRSLAAGAVVVALAAIVVSWAAWLATPAVARETPLLAGLAGVGLLAAVLAAAGGIRLRLVTLVATAAAIAGWGLLRWQVLTHAVLPTVLPEALDRAVTASAIGLGIALAGLAVWKPPAPAPAA